MNRRSSKLGGREMERERRGEREEEGLPFASKESPSLVRLWCVDFSVGSGKDSWVSLDLGCTVAC